MKAQNIAVSLLSVFFLTDHLFASRSVNQPSYEANISSVTVPARTTVVSKAVISDITKKDVSVLLNDPAMNQKWGLAQNQVDKAWKISQGSKKIIVAVIDTGVDVNHEDIKDNLWVNPKVSKVDNGNGIVNDLHGWNFVKNNNDLSDNHGHGTHIAGIIGAVGGNGKGISGISPEVSLMILKYYDPKGYGEDNLKNTIKAIHYAIDNGAHVINYSGGGLEYSQEEKDAIARARKHGILFIAAAGNERSNSDIKKYYPADYGLDNIISVTAIDDQTRVLPSSNYGVLTVDIGAPGNNIYSTLPNNKYGFMTGTSQATAYVSGVASLVLAHHKDYKPMEVSKYLKTTGDIVESLKGKTRYNRRLNSYKALTMLDTGVSATGVVADNTVNMKTFSTETKQETPGLHAFKGFGESLIRAIEHPSN